jgi:hypothetical protein
MAARRRRCEGLKVPAKQIELAGDLAGFLALAAGKKKPVSIETGFSACWLRGPAISVISAYFLPEFRVCHVPCKFKFCSWLPKVPLPRRASNQCRFTLKSGRLACCRFG